LIAAYGSGSWRAVEPVDDQLHEAGLLLLDCTKSRDELGWTGVWDVTTAVRRTGRLVSHLGGGRGRSARRYELRGATDVRGALKADIDSYVAAARARGVPWIQALVGATDGGRR